MRSESKRGAYIGAEVINNNLSFFESVFIFFYRLVFKPLIHETNKRVYTAHTNRGLLIAQLFYRFGVPFTSVCPDLAQVLSIVLLLVLVVLELFVIVFAKSFDKTYHRDSSTGDIEKS